MRCSVWYVASEQCKPFPVRLFSPAHSQSIHSVQSVLCPSVQSSPFSVRMFSSVRFQSVCSVQSVLSLCEQLSVFSVQSVSSPSVLWVRVTGLADARSCARRRERSLPSPAGRRRAAAAARDRRRQCGSADRPGGRACRPPPRGAAARRASHPWPHAPGDCGGLRSGEMTLFTGWAVKCDGLYSIVSKSVYRNYKYWILHFYDSINTSVKS